MCHLLRALRDVAVAREDKRQRRDRLRQPVLGDVAARARERLSMSRAAAKQDAVDMARARASLQRALARIRLHSRRGLCLNLNAARTYLIKWSDCVPLCNHKQLLLGMLDRA